MSDGVVCVHTRRYIKYVTREVPRVELLLKLVSAPRERFVDRCATMQTLCSGIE